MWVKAFGVIHFQSLKTLIIPLSMLFYNSPVKKWLIFMSLWSSFCVSWKAASQMIVWSERCESQRGSEGDDALSLPASLSLTYREWEECKLMSKIIILRLSMASVPMNVCSVSGCSATHSCGMSSRARTEEEEDRVFTNSTLRVIYCSSMQRTYCRPVVRNCRGWTLSPQVKYTVTLSKQEMHKTQLNVSKECLVSAKYRY